MINLKSKEFLNKKVVFIKSEKFSHSGLNGLFFGHFFECVYRETTFECLPCSTEF